MTSARARNSAGDDGRPRFAKGDARRYAEALARNPRAVCEWLFPAGEVRDNDFCIGDVGGNEGQSLRVCMSGPHAGKWIDHAEEGHKGDLLNLVYLHFGCRTIGEAMAEIPDHLLAGAGLDHTDKSTWQADRVTTPKQTPSKDKVALMVWHAAGQVRGTPAEVYFRRRQLAPKNSRFYRFHPAAEYRFTIAAEPHLMDLPGAAVVARKPEQGTVPVPAILYRVTDHAGRFVGINREYINEDGTAAKQLADHKKSLGPVNQGTIWHTFAGRVQVVAEGAPDGIAIHTALPRAYVWSAVSGTHIPNFVPDPMTEIVLIARQADRVGEWSAAQLRDNLAADRPDVRVIEHISIGKDFADDLVDHGAEQLAARFRDAYAAAR